MLVYYFDLANRRLDTITKLSNEKMQLANEHKEDITTINTLSNSRDLLIEAANAKVQSAAVVADRRKWYRNGWVKFGGGASVGVVGTVWLINNLR